MLCLRLKCLSPEKSLRAEHPAPLPYLPQTQTPGIFLETPPILTAPSCAMLQRCSAADFADTDLCKFIYTYTCLYNMQGILQQLPQFAMLQRCNAADFPDTDPSKFCNAAMLLTSQTQTPQRIHRFPLQAPSL